MAKNNTQKRCLINLSGREETLCYGQRKETCPPRLSQTRLYSNAWKRSERHWSLWFASCLFTLLTNSGHNCTTNHIPHYGKHLTQMGRTAEHQEALWLKPSNIIFSLYCKYAGVLVAVQLKVNSSLIRLSDNGRDEFLKRKFQRWHFQAKWLRTEYAASNSSRQIPLIMNNNNVSLKAK